MIWYTNRLRYAEVPVDGGLIAFTSIPDSQSWGRRLVVGSLLQFARIRHNAIRIESALPSVNQVEQSWCSDVSI